MKNKFKSLSTILEERNSNRYKKRITSIVSEIRDKQIDYKNSTLLDLKNKIQTYKDKKISNEMLVDVYAIVTQSIFLLYGLNLYDVQIEGAIALHQGKIAEMKTGEGKTITSSLPIILNALNGSVHVVTVNEYLAKRDKEYLEKLYNSLGLSVGLNLNEMKFVEKKKAYNSDIVYSTASELGFDYLKDNMVTSLDDKVNKKGYNYTLIDEVDLVLIDEARTPLIIGKPKSDNKTEIIKAQNVVKSLIPEDYEFDTKSKGVALTKSGLDKVCNSYNIKNLYSKENISIMYRINQALLANIAYHKDIDYAIAKQSKRKEKEIVIIDQFTGRLYFGRRYTNGLHQAIEAKHLRDGIEIKDETKTVATITLQNFFRLYKKISGMSGTAKEESKEFYDIYGLEVIKIDTNKPVNREDFPIILFEKKAEKWNFIIERIKYHNSKNRPILVGTVSVEDSEVVSKLLKQNKLPHQVLNAKQDKSEADIIKKAGHKKQITVATNMAGRGTDIKVDDDTELVVFVTELNESLRIDNQLKGRTSRQGAYGITETILSIEDSIFKKSKVSSLKTLTIINPLPPALESILRLVQEELESSGYASRQNALKYDDVIREQREIFYKTRDKIINNITDREIYYNNLGGENIYYIKNFTHKDEKFKNELIKDILLSSLDNAWIDHIDLLEKLKEGITWRAYNGANPIITYQDEAKELWEIFKKNVKESINLNSKKINEVDLSEFKTAYERRIN